MDEIPASELTASIYRHTYPRELFRSLEENGAKVEKKHSGIYEVSGLAAFPTQIVVTKELEPETCSVFRVLAPGATEEDVKEFIRQASMNTDAGYRRNADAVLQVSVPANRMLYGMIRKESPEMNNYMRDVLRDFFKEDYIDMVLETMREDGKDDKEIVSRLMMKFNLTQEEAEERVYSMETV